MLSDEFPDHGALAPKTVGGTPVTMTVYVEYVDDVYQRVIDAGATALTPVKTGFFGDRLTRAAPGGEYDQRDHEERRRSKTLPGSIAPDRMRSTGTGARGRGRRAGGREIPLWRRARR